MKGSARRRIALDFSLLKPGRYIGNLIILTVTLIAIGVTILLYVQKYYVRLGFQEAVSVSPNQMACCGVFAVENDIQEKIKTEIREIEEISSLGVLYEEWFFAIDFFEKYESAQREIYKTAQEGNPDDALEKGYVSAVSMGREFWDVFQLSLAAGEEPAQQREGNVTELYVGYELRDVYPVGSEFEIRNSDGDVRAVYRIAGVLEAGSMVMAPEVGGTEAEIGALVLDYLILEIQYPENILQQTGEFFFVSRTSEEMKIAQKKVAELGEKYETDVKVSIIERVMESGERENRSEIARQQYAGLLLAITATIILLVSQVMEQMDFSEAYGIWYANGATKKDMRKVLFYQNLLRLIPAEILTGGGIYYIALYIYDNFQERLVVRQIFFHCIIPGIVLSGALITVAAVLLPLLILNRKEAVDFLSGRISEGKTHCGFLKPVRDWRMSGLLILEILLVLLLLTNAAMYFHSYRYAGETVTLNGSYKNQKTLGISVDWQANIAGDGGMRISETTINELLAFCNEVKDLPVPIVLYANWMIAMPYEYATTGLLLTGSTPPQRLKDGSYQSNQQGIYLSEALLPLLEKDEKGKYLEVFHTRLPLLGTVAASGQETEDSLYVYFQTLEETTQREILTEMIKVNIDADYLEPFALVVGSNDTDIAEAVAAVKTALTDCSMISCEELTTDEAIVAIAGDHIELQNQALFRLLMIGIVMFFCIISLIQVLSLWMERKREEITVRWALGMKKKQILWGILQEILYLLSICILVCSVLELGICWGIEKYSFLQALAYMAAAAAGAFVIFFVILMYVFSKGTRSMNLAEMLRE